MKKYIYKVVDSPSFVYLEDLLNSLGEDGWLLCVRDSGMLVLMKEELSSKTETVSINGTKYTADKIQD